ncbi:bifunctional adenosylcobinamide kinase/adenosylcobinamide-phosphate guanylyltransferase [Caulobacter sp. FWC2]|uniref:bifunctional adenosylcobinamide kinase/adenosylcobinamide-phosphate guanylyltransferase n=1 Tax=Caulobacter sp. FWC2 TaxID=69664 RepID=UPI000C14EF37|nr:bifunctional adenosylcobinamide kinase/adenosylcobinamide-phosphate guanylyltransferase [Caulobacter sp. FWC2]PIB92105.1 bifunctional adenosylcobinamide kinase/adenosylcobinamide-phosphate guanylyltransferase [Caulobacter sp. FWC2]
MTSILVLGGARSGKSAFAQKAAETAVLAGSPVLIATGQAFDDEMAERIARHQADRGESWRTVEAPLALAEAIAALPADAVAVVDCLTLWLSNLMLDERDIAAAATALVEAVAACPARLWLVSNEVGLGLVPETPLGRRFRDEAGRLHQRLAQAVDEVYFVAAGLPLKLKPQG